MTAMLDRLGIGAERRLQLRKFSKGMLQRVGLAQALLNEPEVIFLDEPMSGLDPLGRRDVRALMLELRDQGRTIFFSSHILSDAEVLCSRVAIVAKGRLAASGRLADLQEFAVQGWELVVSGVPPAILDRLRASVRRVTAITGDRFAIDLPADAQPDRLLTELIAAGATLCRSIRCARPWKICSCGASRPWGKGRARRRVGMHAVEMRGRRGLSRVRS